MAVNKEQVKQYMLKLISAGDKEYAAKTVDSFGLSKSTVYNYAKQLCDDGIIIKRASEQYELVNKVTSFRYNNENLSEDRVFNKDIAPLLTECAKNAQSIWRYAFTEMMNNAIEHSGASVINVTVLQNCLNTTVGISDNGMGIFKNIQNYMKTEKNDDIPLDECVSLLFAGKFTTAKANHSGEGIFFTSHMMDSFLIISDNNVFSRNSFTDKQITDISYEKGTIVTMSLHNQTKKTTLEVFNRFSDIDEGFTRTHIPIAHMFPAGNPVSRSEARRLSAVISGFKEITLDFSNVEEVGQAFCHELFVLWQNKNPDIVLNIAEANEAVDYMIKRVKNTK